MVIHTCSCRKRLTATEGEYSAVCSTIMQYSFSLFGNTRLTLSHHAPVPALGNAACSPLPGPPLMTVTSVLDDEGCFTNKNIYIFVVSLHIITICNLLTLGTDEKRLSFYNFIPRPCSRVIPSARSSNSSAVSVIHLSGRRATSGSCATSCSSSSNTSPTGVSGVVT